jgi:predicted nucleic acid-binding protein
VRVYAESNFVLELALEQEQHRACEDLVRLAADAAIELVLPSFALLEPYHTLVRRKGEGNDLQLQLQLHVQAKQLERTASIAMDAPRLREAADLVLRADQAAWKRFLEVRSTLLRVARVSMIDGRVLDEALKLAADIKQLELPDAVMLAAVLVDAAERPSQSVFLNRNTRDFNDPDIKARLEQVSCELIGGFHGGLARVKHILANATTTHPPSSL